MNVMEDLKAYLDGELSPVRRAEVEAAMEQDPRLKQELEEIRVLSRLIGDCILDPEPVGLEQALTVLAARQVVPFWQKPFKEPVRYGWVWTMACFVLFAIFMPTFQQTKMARMSAGRIGSIQDDNAGVMSKASTPTADVDKLAEGTGYAPATAAPMGGAGGFGSATRGGQEGEVNNYQRTTQPRQTFGGAFVGGDSMGVNTPPSEAQKARRGDYPKLQGQLRKGLVGQAEMAPDAAKKDESSQPSVRIPVKTPLGAHLTGQGRAQGGPAFAPPLLVRTAQLSLRVASVRTAQADATNMVKSFAGYVEESGSSLDEGSVPSAELTLRVPEPKFETTMNALRKLGVVISEAMTGQDVTAQVADTESKLKELRAEEISYLGMLKGTKHIEDTLAVRDRLDTVQQTIASLQAQDKALRDQAVYSTITLSLTEAAAPPKPVAQPTWFQTAWSGAAERASGLGKWFAEIGMNLLFLAPVWVPVAGLFWWLGRRRVRR